MSFVARYHGECGFCGDELQGTETSYGNGDTLVHTGRCLVLFNTGVTPGAEVGRNERRCGQCFQIHAGECL